ncbi:MAG: OmpA family protein [Tannerella sp.]|jgi:outer membrane protein OmpA-like peptidoglycan-associated protein|nr:OmpA family protein [Tannerella sp.]
MKIFTIRQKIELKKQSCHRLWIVLAFMLCAVGLMTAQQSDNDIQQEEEVYVYENAPNEYLGQWFAGINGGANLFFADHARQLSMRYRISGGADIYFGKWWGPVFGSRLGASWQSLRGATKYSITGRNGAGVKQISYSHAITTFPSETKDPLPIDIEIFGNHGLFREQFDTYHIHFDMMFDASNFFAGVNEDRIVSAIPYVGVGSLMTYDRPKANTWTVNAGLMTTFKILKNMDLVLDVHGTAFEEKFKNPQRDFNITEPDANGNWNRLNLDNGTHPYDGIFSVNLGLQFRFGDTKRQPRRVVTYQPEPEYTYVPPPVQETIVETETEFVTEWLDKATDVLIIFKINQSVLLDDAKVKLNFLGQLMQEYPVSSYTITGYADESTGYPELNYRLSVERSKRVKDYLVNVCGIPESRLRTDAAGGVPNQFYNDPSLSRSVIIRPNRDIQR